MSFRSQTAASSSAPPHASDEDHDQRRILPRRGVPNGRAVVGGLLVAIAAIGIFVAQRDASRPPQRRYFVARHDLRAGQALAPDDVELRAVDLPPSLARGALADGVSLAHVVLVAGARAGELVQRSQIVDLGAAPGQLEVSLAVDPARALGGRLQPGDRVAIAVASDTGAPATVLATDLEVVDLAPGGGGLGRSGELTVTLAGTAEQVIGVAGATSPQHVTVVRTTGAIDTLRTSTTTPLPAAGG